MGIKAKLEYIWLDGCKPTQSLRSKTKVVEDFSGELADTPTWAFDGSSTQQASGDDSDCLLKPVAVYPDPARKNGWLVMSEVLSADRSPHPSNGRATIEDESEEFWFGFEQEYCIWDNQTQKPIGFPAEGYPEPQGPFYCSVGGQNTFGRKMVDEHLDLCLDAGLTIEGINAEVMAGQWEFQVFAKGAKKAGDECWMARYLLERTVEKYGYSINWEPKPVKGDWNGSGMHTNFSNELLRTCGDQAVFEQVCKAFGEKVQEHMEVYGAHNDQRLTGLHETQAIDTFSFGVSDRGASIRIGIATVEAGWKGWLEDRRPASNADPYKVASRIVSTLKEVSAKLG